MTWSFKGKDENALGNFMKEIEKKKLLNYIPMSIAQMIARREVGFILQIEYTIFF